MDFSVISFLSFFVVEKCSRSILKLQWMIIIIPVLTRKWIDWANKCISWWLVGIRRICYQLEIHSKVNRKVFRLIMWYEDIGVSLANARKNNSYTQFPPNCFTITVWKCLLLYDNYFRSIYIFRCTNVHSAN